MVQNGLSSADVPLRKYTHYSLTHCLCIVASWDSCSMSNSINWQQCLYVHVMQGSANRL